MVSRHYIPLVVVAVLASTGAAFRTQNFMVEAPTPEIAQQVGQYAEYYRKTKALEWLGQEMPAWPDPCPLVVKVTMGGAGGATSFNFDQGRVFQHMEIEGTLERLLASVLPHEVTHTVFAHFFRRPVPRWADEGGAVLSEDDIERARHDQLVRHILNTPGRAIQLRTLFNLKEYPRDVMSLYAEGFSVADYLVGLGNRQTFLNFVAVGMTPTRGWDAAAQAYYHFNTIEELEQAWLGHLRALKQQREQGLLAKNTAPGAGTNHVLVRQTVPPAQPFVVNGSVVGQPIYRGQAGDDSDDRSGYLPNAAPMASARPTVTLGGPEQWQPAGATSPTVRLGAPEYIASPPGVSSPSQGSPIGYPH